MGTIIPVLFRLFIVLVVLEILARVASTIQSDLYTDPERWYAYSSTVGWTRAPGFRGSMECGVARNFDENGFRDADSSQVFDRDRKKIVFLGDSTTMGFCVETADSFVELIDDMLPEASAINLGLNGYTSYQGVRTLGDIGELLGPDLIVASFNFNDRRYVLDASQADSTSAYEATLQIDRRRRIAESLETSYIVRGLRTVLSRAGVVTQTSVPSTVDLAALRPRVTREQYKENLADIARWARAHGSQLLFVVLGDNPARTARLDNAIERMQSGDYTGAAEDLWVVRRDEWFGDLARLQQARLYTETGRAEQAAAVTKAESYWSQHGGRPIVLDTVYNAAMREVADEYHVDVVDVRTVLNQTPGIFIDNAHFDERGHRIVADVLLDPIKKLLGDSPPGAP